MPIEPARRFASTWPESLDPVLRARLRRPLEFGVVSTAMARRVFGWVEYFERRRALLAELLRRRGQLGSGRPERVPIVHARWAGDAFFEGEPGARQTEESARPVRGRPAPAENASAPLPPRRPAPPSPEATAVVAAAAPSHGLREPSSREGDRTGESMDGGRPVVVPAPVPGPAWDRRSAGRPLVEAQRWASAGEAAPGTPAPAERAVVVQSEPGAAAVLERPLRVPPAPADLISVLVPVPEAMQKSGMGTGTGSRIEPATTEVRAPVAQAQPSASASAERRVLVPPAPLAASEERGADPFPASSAPVKPEAQPRQERGVENEGRAPVVVQPQPSPSASAERPVLVPPASAERGADSSPAPSASVKPNSQQRDERRVEGEGRAAVVVQPQPSAPASAERPVLLPLAPAPAPVQDQEGGRSSAPGSRAAGHAVENERWRAVVQPRRAVVDAIPERAQPVSPQNPIVTPTPRRPRRAAEPLPAPESGGLPPSLRIVRGGGPSLRGALRERGNLPPLLPETGVSSPAPAAPETRASSRAPAAVETMASPPAPAPAAPETGAPPRGLAVVAPHFARKRRETRGTRVHVTPRPETDAPPEQLPPPSLRPRVAPSPREPTRGSAARASDPLPHTHTRIKGSPVGPGPASPPESRTWSFPVPAGAAAAPSGAPMASGRGPALDVSSPQGALAAPSATRLAGARGEINLDVLTDKVQRKLLRRLAVEQERKGGLR